MKHQRLVTSSRSRARRWAGRAAWVGLPPLVKGVGRLAWRLDIDQSNGLPDPPFVVAANHHSFLDAVLIGAIFGRKVRFLALIDLFGNHRWLDFALSAMEVIPLHRDLVPVGPMRTALFHLEAGGAVGLFPEGTRHWRFEPDRALPGAAWLSARTGAPLVPVAISGTERILGVDNRLGSGRIRIAIGPAMHAGHTNRAAVDDLTARWGRWVSEALSRRHPSW